MKQIEERVMTQFDSQIAQSGLALNQKFDTLFVEFNERLARLEQIQQNSRNRVISASQITSENGRLDPDRMEEALNEWLAKVEEQVNHVEDKVLDKATQFDLQGLETRLGHFEARTGQVEELSARIAEQAIHSYDEVKLKVIDIEEKYSLVQRHLENSLLNHTHNSLDSTNNASPSRK